MLPASVAVVMTPLTEATGLASWAWLLIAIPAVFVAFLLLAGRRSNAWSHWPGLAASLVIACLGVGIPMQVLGLSVEERAISLPLYRWFSVGSLSVDVDLHLGPLPLTSIALVTCVSFLIHLYSAAYMAHGRDRRRFLTYLNLFIAAMLTLVLGGSYIALFVGWKDVKLTFYLLIGFWGTADADAPQGEQATSRKNAAAAKKAFIMNCVSDVDPLLAMMAMVGQVDSASFDAVSAASLDGSMSIGWLTAIGFFLLLAACDKSAQFPLQARLGNAMADPMPISVLIHAATIVAAGVYLMVRSTVVFEGAPSAQTAVAVIGAITLLLGVVIGSTKDGMKKVLAAPTMGQIDYTMLGTGLGPVGYAFTIFHLLTHGFFRAQLFLGAGSVMHAMGDRVNMRRFGGLRGTVTITWITMGIGWLAVLGVPPFSGFWSKDHLIETAFVGEDVEPWILGTIALLGADLTASYVSRLFFMVSHGKQHWITRENLEGEVRPYESGQLMTLPLIVLSMFSAGLDGLLTYNNMSVTWLEPVTGHVEHGEPVLPATTIMDTILAPVVVGALVTWQMYMRRPVPVVLQSANPPVEAARKDMYQDAISEALAMHTDQGLVLTVDAVKRCVVDGAIEGAAAGTGTLGHLTRRTEPGYVRLYAGYILTGMVLVLIAVLAARF